MLTASGALVAISHLKVGQKVLATSTKTGKTRSLPVAAVLVHHDTDRYNLTVRAGRRSAVIHTTRNHLFWDPASHRWVKAATLRYGTHLRIPGRGTVTVTGGHDPKTWAGWMWDLTIPTDHDFYIQAASTDVLVHNCTEGPASEAVQAKVAEMQSGMTDAEAGRTTYAAAQVTTAEGNEEMWVAGAGKSGYVRPAIRGDALNMPFPAPGELSGRLGINDAEMHLFRAAQERGATINAIGATHQCVLCAKEGCRMTSPLLQTWNTDEAST